MKQQRDIKENITMVGYRGGPLVVSKILPGFNYPGFIVFVGWLRSMFCPYLNSLFQAKNGNSLRIYFSRCKVPATFNLATGDVMTICSLAEKNGVADNVV